MKEIKNPEDVDAVIVFNAAGDLLMVVPEEFEIGKNEPVKWVISPHNQATVSFGHTRSPLKWDDKGDSKAIVGDVKPNAKAGAYKYTVTDTKGNIIDPRMRVRG